MTRNARAMTLSWAEGQTSAQPRLDQGGVGPECERKGLGLGWGASVALHDDGVADVLRSADRCLHAGVEAARLADPPGVRPEDSEVRTGQGRRTGHRRAGWPGPAFG